MRSTRLLPILLPVLFLLVLPAGSAGAKEPPTLAESLRALARPYVDAQVFVGGVLAVSKDGEREVVPFGRLAADAEKAPDGDTVYEIGSVTKVFTGILLADLVREGKVRLDQPVQELLPEGVTMPKKGAKDVTLEHLATHTSGLPRMPSNFEPADIGNPYADYDAERMFAWLESGELSQEPGSKYEYSNLGVGLLGVLLARVDGSTYEAMLKKRILVPLGMGSTGITLTDDMQTRLAPPYTVDLAPTSSWDLVAFAGAGAIRSTVNDMLRFAEAQLAAEGPLRETFDLALAIHHTPPGDAPRIGLGWHTGKGGQGRWHNGQTGGYHAWLQLRRDEKAAVVLLVNTATMQGDVLGGSAMKRLLGEPIDAPKLRVPAAIDPERLDDYEGTYRLTPAFALVLERKGDGLFLQATGQPQVRVYPEGEDAFFLRAAPARVVFERDEEGRVVRLVLFQNGRMMPAPREE